MAPSKVFFTDMRCRAGKNMVDKLDKLCRKAGIAEIDFSKKFAAIKMHFGEPGNTASIRPVYAAKIAAIVRELGGTPFLTDSNTLYSGRRANAPDHLRAAAENGFTETTVGCEILIADGLKGTEYREIEIGAKHCKTAKIGSGVADADILICLSHFKGHDLTGFGGALKNLGMGSASRGGKLVMHSASKPVFNREKCVGCGICVKNCAWGAIVLDAEHRAVMDPVKCVGCGQCIAMCRYDAVNPNWEDTGSVQAACERMAEYAWAVVKDRPSFHVNLIVDVSPNCDCWDMSDAPIVPNIGFAASFDPVALDKACLDLVNQAPAMPGSALTDKEGWTEGRDKFTALWPSTDWRFMLEHAQALGAGNMEYELVKL